MYFQSNTSPSREVKDVNTTYENNLIRDVQFGHKTQYPATLTGKGRWNDFLHPHHFEPGLEIKAFSCFMAPKAWKPTCSLDLRNLHPSYLQRGWQTDFSWHNMHFDLSMTQEWRCKDSLCLLLCVNASECQTESRAGRETAGIAYLFLSISVTPPSFLSPMTSFSVTLFFNTLSKTLYSKWHLLTLSQFPTIWLGTISQLF